jgi:hypothetical protein
MTSKSTEDDKAPEVFDVANWLDRATINRPVATPGYEPKHRAEESPV